jgi:dTDP-4-dehydrorhamnose reductase
VASRLLIFGSTGQLGRALARADWGRGAELVFLDRKAADFSAPEGLGDIVREQRPDAVIIAAAYTAVDRAEGEEALATCINAQAPGVIATAAAERGVPVVAFSTDYVFDGTKNGRYVEDDAARPLNAYGRSKLAGEQSVREANPRHVILRTSWVYSPHGANFLRTMLRLASTRANARVVADQMGCPTSAADLAQAIARLMPLLFDRGAPYGTYHLAGRSETSWHGFAEAIFSELDRRGVARPHNDAIGTDDYPSPARRPLNSRLSSDLAAATFGISLAGFEEAVPRVLDEILVPARAEEEA